MARAFLSGFVVGTAMLAGAAAVTSFLVGPPAPPEISVDLGTARVTPPRSAELSGPVPIQGGGVSSKPQKPAVVDAPEVERQANFDIEAVRPASRPTAGETSADVSEPTTPAETGGVSVDGDAPVAANRRAAVPDSPAGEDPAAIVTNPPLPAGSGVAGAGPGPSVGDGLRVPEAAEEDRPVVPGADRAFAQRVGAPLAQSSPDQPRRPEVLVQSAPQPETDIAAPSEAGDTTGQRDTLIAPSPDGSSTTPTAPARAQAPEPEAAPSAGRLPPAGAAVTDTGGTREIVLPQAGSTAGGTGRVAPAIGTPATSLLQRDGGQAAPVEDAAEGETEDDAAATELDPPALVQNAEPFETTAGDPLMSIILMDTGQDRDEDTIGLAALRSFPYPLSFAVDTGLPDAAERAEAYRAAGYEVLALVNLPAEFDGRRYRGRADGEPGSCPASGWRPRRHGDGPAGQQRDVFASRRHPRGDRPRHRLAARRARHRAKARGSIRCRVPYPLPQSRQSGSDAPADPAGAGSGRLQGKPGRLCRHGRPYAPRHDIGAPCMGAAGSGATGGGHAGLDRIAGRSAERLRGAPAKTGITGELLSQDR